MEKLLLEEDNETLRTALNWSQAINNDVERMVYGISPFPYMKDSLELMRNQADIMVVSQTPIEALKREWDENNISKFAALIAGQEFGTKTEHLQYGAVGKYDKDKILMIGDAPGDLQAAKANGVLFYPINPGEEELSWKRFCNESLEKFFRGEYLGEYENSLIKEFEEYLPTNPPWEGIEK